MCTVRPSLVQIIRLAQRVMVLALARPAAQRVQLRGGTLHLYVASYDHCDPVAASVQCCGAAHSLSLAADAPLILQRLHPDGADHDRRFFMFYSSVSMKPRTSRLTVNSTSFEVAVDAPAGLGTQVLIYCGGRGGRPRVLCK